MRITEFWRRLEEQLGSGYARSWAADTVLVELGGRTVEQSLAAGENAKDIWRAVVLHLELPANRR